MLVRARWCVGCRGVLPMGADPFLSWSEGEEVARGKHLGGCYHSKCCQRALAPSWPAVTNAPAPATQHLPSSPCHTAPAPARCLLSPYPPPRGHRTTPGLHCFPSSPPCSAPHGSTALHLAAASGSLPTAAAILRACDAIPMATHNTLLPPPRRVSSPSPLQRPPRLYRTTPRCC